jgi:predicted component of type VI protein secretion system
MHISTLRAETGLSLQARAIHPAGSEADIQATPNWAWRCAAASLLESAAEVLNSCCVRSQRDIPLHRRESATHRIAWVNAVVQELCSISDAAEELQGGIADEMPFGLFALWHTTCPGIALGWTI